MLSSLKYHLKYGKKKVENAIQQMKSISTHIAFVITIVSNNLFIIIIRQIKYRHLAFDCLME